MLLVFAFVETLEDVAVHLFGIALKGRANTGCSGRATAVSVSATAATASSASSSAATSTSGSQIRLECIHVVGSAERDDFITQLACIP